jgi:hypothetical protein
MHGRVFLPSANRFPGYSKVFSSSFKPQQSAAKLSGRELIFFSIRNFVPELPVGIKVFPEDHFLVRVGQNPRAELTDVVAAVLDPAVTVFAPFRAV